MIIIQKYRKNDSFAYFVMYSTTCVLFACGISGLGPAIPFLTQLTGIKQTQYSFLFMNRAIGFIAMTIGIKMLQKYLTIHQMMIIGSCGFCFSYIMFTLTLNTFIQGTVVFLGSASISLMMIVNNIGMLTSHQGKDQQFWLQLNHGTFGIGGLIGPVIIRYFHIKGFILISLLALAVSPFYFIYKSPEIVKQEKAQEALMEGKSLSHQSKLYKIRKQSIKYFYLTAFLIIGIEVSFPGWAPSYAVIQQINVSEEATVYGSIFWIAMTFSRFIFAFVQLNVTSKLKFAVTCSILTSIICSFFSILKFDYLSLYLSALFLGAFFAPYFPLTLALPGQYNFFINDDQLSNLFIWASIGQGVISYLFGFLMQIKIEMFFHFSTIICLILFYSLFKMIHQLQDQNQQLDEKRQQYQQYEISSKSRQLEQVLSMR